MNDIVEQSLNAARRSRYEIDYGMSIYFAEIGMRHATRTSPFFFPLKAEIATSGFYCEDPALRELGQAACEELTLARDCHPAARHVAFQNLFHYTKKLSDYAPSFHAERVVFDVPPGYYPTNPSICRLGGQMYLNVRCVNYYTEADEKVILPTEEFLGTRNFLLHVSEEDIGWHATYGEVLSPQDLPRLNEDMPVGVEDIRLFPRHDGLWASGTVVQTNTGKMAEIMVARIAPNLGMDRWRICSVAPWRHQKNWSPIIEKRSSGAPRLIYSYDPHHIYEDGLSLGTPQPPIAAHTWSGSTQAIPWGGGYLVMIHEKMYYPEMKFTRRWYQQRFVFYDVDWNMRKISRRFQFDNGETEFPCGMCIHPDGERLVISYGVLDREAWLATVNIDEVQDMLYDVGDR